MTKRILDSFHLFRWAYQLLPIRTFGVIVVLTFLDAQSCFCLSNIICGHFKAVFLFDVSLELFVGGFTLRNSHVFGCQIKIYMDRIAWLLLGQRNYSLSCPNHGNISTGTANLSKHAIVPNKFCKLIRFSYDMNHYTHLITRKEDRPRLIDPLSIA